MARAADRVNTLLKFASLGLLACRLPWVRHTAAIYCERFFAKRSFTHNNRFVGVGGVEAEAQHGGSTSCRSIAA
jgi:hypothetical protein